jgi:hypothetical protein
VNGTKNNSEQAKNQPRNCKWPFNELRHWQRTKGESKHTKQEGQKSGDNCPAPRDKGSNG